MSLALVLRPLDASGKGTPPPLTETNGSRSATHTCARWSMMTVGELAERVGDLGGDLARPCREVRATHLVGSATGGSFRAVREIDVEMCGRSRDSAERLLRALKRQDRRSAPPTLHITLARLDEAARGEAARTGPASLA